MESQEWRTTAELIEELDTEGTKFTHVLLAVGFENSTIFVRADDPNRLSALNDAVKQGGEPVGFIGLKIGEGHASFYRRALREHEEWAVRYLDDLIGKAAKALDQSSYGQEDGWIN